MLQEYRASTVIFIGIFSQCLKPIFIEVHEKRERFFRVLTLKILFALILWLYL